jgi:MFS family permease
MQVILLSLTIVLKDEWDLPIVMTQSSLFAGSMMGTLILGPLADSMGRRPYFAVALHSVFGFGTRTAMTNYFCAWFAAVAGRLASEDFTVPLIF